MNIGENLARRRVLVEEMWDALDRLRLLKWWRAHRECLRLEREAATFWQERGLAD